MAEIPGSSKPPTRRAVFTAAGGAGLAAALTACGSDSDPGSAAGAPSSGATASDAPAPTPSDTGMPSPSDSAPSGSGTGGAPLGKTADIPVGGGKVFADQKVVVTQPTAGNFKGFSAICTHRGCVVADVSDGTINCGCHGSKFHAADGSVAHGPATSPLPAQPVAVSGGTVSLA